MADLVWKSVQGKATEIKQGGNQIFINVSWLKLLGEILQYRVLVVSRGDIFRMLRGTSGDILTALSSDLILPKSFIMTLNYLEKCYEGL